jgi:hypothetical protein
LNSIQNSILFARPLLYVQFYSKINLG